MLYTLVSAPQTLKAWTSDSWGSNVLWEQENCNSEFAVTVTNLYAFKQLPLLLSEALTVKVFVVLVGLYFFFLMGMNPGGMKMTDCSYSFAKNK